MLQGIVWLLRLWGSGRSNLGGGSDRVNTASKDQLTDPPFHLPERRRVLHSCLSETVEIRRCLD
jgi:hypothetical protein